MSLWKAAVLIGTLPFVILGCNSASTPKPPPYNVLFFSLDTLRADRVGVYGFKDWDITPTIDALAKRGVVFTSTYATATITTASHMSMFTGLLPAEHRVESYAIGASRWGSLPEMLGPGVVSMPEYMRRAGYATARFVYSRDFFLDPSIGFGRGYNELFPYGMDAEISTNAIAKWIGQHKNQRFFAFIHSKRPHAPFVFPKEVKEEADEQGHLSPYDGGLPATYNDWFGEIGKLVPHYCSMVPGIFYDDFYFFDKVRRDRDEDINRVRELYSLGVNLTDRYLGKIVDALKKSGLDDQTIIVVTSDHGEGLMEHKMLSHQVPYEEAAHVPLIISLPKPLLERMKSRRIDALTQSTDILPTLLALLDISEAHRMSGKSLLPLLTGEATSVRDSTYSSNTLPYMAITRAYRTSQWSLLTMEKKPHQLFDRKQDLAEAHDVAAQHPEVVQELLRKIEDIQTSAVEYRGRYDPPKLAKSALPLPLDGEPVVGQSIGPILKTWKLDIPRQAKLKIESVNTYASGHVWVTGLRAQNPQRKETLDITVRTGFSPFGVTRFMRDRMRDLSELYKIQFADGSRPKFSNCGWIKPEWRKLPNGQIAQIGAASNDQGIIGYCGKATGRQTLVSYLYCDNRNALYEFRYHYPGKLPNQAYESAFWAMSCG